MHASPTIFALSSGQGRAGVAVIRLSGPAAGPVLDRMAAPRPRPRYAAFRRVTDPRTAEVLDQALVLWFPGPASETGEDMAELQVHGGRAVVQGVLGALASISGCRLAQPGEFARRAFENGKLDLTGVEGLADLIDAETAAQRRQALRQAEGALYQIYENWRQGLIAAMALTEAAIDFSDEPDVAADALGKAQREIAPIAQAITAHLDDDHRGELVRDGFQVVLAGAPNVGKSSLLNALARRDVAIVSDEPGTTRDVIEVKLELQGLPVVLSDTAGIRAAVGKVEEEGIKRTWQRLRAADLVLWLMDAADPNSSPSSSGAGRQGRSPADPLQQGRSHLRQRAAATVRRRLDHFRLQRLWSGRLDPASGGARRGAGRRPGSACADPGPASPAAVALSGGAQLLPGKPDRGDRTAGRGLAAGGPSLGSPGRSHCRRGRPRSGVQPLLHRQISSGRLDRRWGLPNGASGSASDLSQMTARGAGARRGGDYITLTSFQKPIQ